MASGIGVATCIVAVRVAPLSQSLPSAFPGLRELVRGSGPAHSMAWIGMAKMLGLVGGRRATRAWQYLRYDDEQISREARHSNFGSAIDTAGETEDGVMAALRWPVRWSPPRGGGGIFIGPENESNFIPR